MSERRHLVKPSERLLRLEIYSYQAQNTFFISHNNLGRCQERVSPPVLPMIQMYFFIKTLTVLSPGVRHIPPALFISKAVWGVLFCQMEIVCK